MEGYNEGPRMDTELGGTNDLLEFGGEEKNGISTIWWRRKLSTGDDDYDYTLDESMGSIKAVWAFGTGKGIAKHMATNRGIIDIDFFSGEIHFLKEDQTRQIVSTTLQSVA